MQNGRIYDGLCYFLHSLVDRVQCSKIFFCSQTFFFNHVTIFFFLLRRMKEATFGVQHNILLPYIHSHVQKCVSFYEIFRVICRGFYLYKKKRGKMQFVNNRFFCIIIIFVFLDWQTVLKKKISSVYHYFTWFSSNILRKMLMN